jgi:hypothetical protein
MKFAGNQGFFLFSAPSLYLPLGGQRFVARGALLAVDQRDRAATEGMTSKERAGIVLRDPLLKCVRVTRVVRIVGTAQDVKPE